VPNELKTEGSQPQVVEAGQVAGTMKGQYGVKQPSITGLDRPKQLKGCRLTQLMTNLDAESDKGPGLKML
jgi:hypothetical protein